MKSAIAIALPLPAACAALPVTPVSLPPGQWGGEQIALEVAPDGSGRIELSCGSAGWTGPVKVDVGGHFLTFGHYERGTGVAMQSPPPPEPASISGRLDRSGILWLDIALRDTYPVRSARLQRGAAANLMRCL